MGKKSVSVDPEWKVINVNIKSVVQVGWRYGGFLFAFKNISPAAAPSIFLTSMAETFITDCLSLASPGKPRRCQVVGQLRGNSIKQKETHVTKRQFPNTALATLTGANS